MKQTEYIFLTGVALKEIRDEIKSKSKVALQYAPDTFQSALIEGLANTLSEINVINIPFLGSFPINYKSALSPADKVFTYSFKQGKAKIINKQFLNLTYLKLFTIEYVAFRALKKFINNSTKSNIVNILIYSVNLPFLRAAKRIKDQNNKVRITVIVPDLPEFKNDTNLSTLKRWLYSYDTHISDSLYASIDGYVLLSKHMKERIPIDGKPNVIVEGIYTDDLTHSVLKDNVLNENKSIFYSGTLAKRYNIMNLLDAFNIIKDSNVTLKICGAGSCGSEIKRRAQADPRIKFLGTLPHEEVIELQRKSTLLINPRTPEGDYTRYSFPSKTMEYMASGTPTLLYRLDSIPDDYYNYCFSISNDYTPENLARKIEELLSIPSEELIALGASARKFILENKNAESQGKLIAGLMNSYN